MLMRININVIAMNVFFYSLVSFYLILFSNPPPLLRRRSSLSRRPLSVYEPRPRGTITQLNMGTRQGKKSMSVPCINPATQSFPSIHSTVAS